MMTRVVAAVLCGMLAVATAGAQPRASRAACLTVRDQRGQHPVVGALLRPAEPSRERLSLVTDSLGRACLAGRDTIALRIDALGFIPVDLALATNGQPPVQLYALPAEHAEAEWGRSQIVAALAESRRQREVQRDTVLVSVLDLVQRRIDSLPPEISVTRDSAGPVVFGYADLSADGSYTAELRLRIVQARGVVFGVTTRHCEESCAREFDAAVSWVPRDGTGWRIAQLIRQTTTADAVTVALGGALVAPEVAPRVSDTVTVSAQTVAIVRGVVRDAKGRGVRDIEVYSADGTATTQTDARGAYALQVNMPPGGVLLTTRRIGWAPQFRAVAVSEGREVTWNPVLRSTAVLARQLVTATGVPPALQSPRYAEFLERRARGVGEFFVAEEIWSAVSLGDLLNRSRGFTARFTYGNRLDKVRVANCNGVIGLYIDDTEVTAFRGFRLNAPGLTEAARDENLNTVENILPQYVNSAFVGMELYHTRLDIPGIYSRPYYCAVIALWTR